MYAPAGFYFWLRLLLLSHSQSDSSGAPAPPLLNLAATRLAIPKMGPILRRRQASRKLTRTLPELMIAGTGHKVVVASFANSQQYQPEKRFQLVLPVSKYN